jgi:hemoglobin-like flavoprotein
MTLQADLLETSFARIRDRQTEFTDYFYSTLFADYPQVQPLFAHTQMNEQPKKLFASLVLVVDNLSQPNELTQSLKGLGARHLKYGVLPEHYPLVGGTLLKAMQFILKDDWTPEVKKAWTEAYSAIAEIMLDGADYSQDILKPNWQTATI